MNTESKRDRFIRIAEARTNKILEMFDYSKFSSRSNYEYTMRYKKNFGALEKELKNKKNKFFRILQEDALH